MKAFTDALSALFPFSPDKLWHWCIGCNSLHLGGKCQYHCPLSKGSLEVACVLLSLDSRAQTYPRHVEVVGKSLASSKVGKHCQHRLLLAVPNSRRDRNPDLNGAFFAAEEIGGSRWFHMFQQDSTFAQAVCP